MEFSHRIPSPMEFSPVLAVLGERLSTQGFQQQAAGHLHRRDPGGDHDATDTCVVRKVVPSRKVCWLRKP